MSRRKFKIGTTTKIVDKSPVNGTRSYAEGFNNSELTTSQFIAHICKGHAFTAHFSDGYRRTENFLCSDFIAADIDSGMTIKEAIQSDFIRKFATFLYTTPSHSDDFPRFRIVFLIDETIINPNDWKNALLGLAVMLESDQSIKDAGRLFFGSKEAVVHTIGKTLPMEEVRKLIRIGKDARAQRMSSNQNAPLTSSQKIDPDGLVQLTNGSSVPLKQLKDTTSVRCPFHLDRHSSAFVVRSTSGSLGIHCMSCRTTFWCEAEDDYDFDHFDRLVEEQEQIAKKTSASQNHFRQFFPPAPNLHRLEQRFLPQIDYLPGITLIKSPKGSGKTEVLKSLISKIHSGRGKGPIPVDERSKSVLLIGHRRSLIQEAANKLGLECYLDGKPYRRRVKGYAICLDSLHYIAESDTVSISRTIVRTYPPIHYDTIILDESEQIFRHILSETIQKGVGADRIHQNLMTMLSKAKAIFALDADLGLITGHALKSYRPDFWANQCRLVVNRPVTSADSNTLYRFKSRKHLIKKMLEAIKSGKRCFITSNSKKLVHVLAEIIHREFNNKISLKVITADNSQSESEKSFVENIKSEYLKIQVLLCSPSLGTGIDITFPNNESHVDEVFGFFYSHVNTHFDIDQQLSRVRNPGRVSVWISSHKNRQEINFDVIRTELVSSNWIQSAKVFDPDTKETICDADHPLVMISAHMISAQRASKKRMIYLFEKLREQTGWKTEVVESEKLSKRSPEKEAKQSLKARRIEGILAAEDLEPLEYLELAQDAERGEFLTQKQKWQVEKARLRLSYNTPVTKSLIELDDSGRLEGKINDFDFLTFQLAANYTNTETKGVLGSTVKKLKRPKNPMSLLADILATTTLVPEGTFVGDIFVNNFQLKDFIKICKANQILIEESLKIELRDDLKANPVRQLNALLNLVGLKLIDRKRSKRKGKNLRYYGIDPSSLKLMSDLSSKFVSRDALRYKIRNEVL